MNNAPPDLAAVLPAQTYYHLVHTLHARLPPPLADTPEALIARNEAAIGQVAAMLPTNDNEAALAAQCVAARAQADDTLRLLREHDGDITVVMKLNAQYVAMVRASLGAHGHLLRVQALRHKREASDAASDRDAWTQHIATRLMQQSLEAAGVPVASVSAAPVPVAEAPPAPEPTAIAPRPAPAPVTLLTRRAAAKPPMAAPEAGRMPSPESSRAPAPIPAPPAAPPPPRRNTTPVEADDPLRDLVSEAEHYAIVYPRRAREIRRHGGLPPSCSFGPPDDALVHAVATGTTPQLRGLDDQDAGVG
jgi:hypothetical protein